MQGGSGYTMLRGGYTGGQQQGHGSQSIAGQQRWGQQGMAGGNYGSGMSPGYSGYNEGGQQSGTQNRYGSQGYQGFGGQLSHRGKGPSGYQRSDERIRELVCEALADDHNVDASNIDITVKSGEVILSGTVEDRQQKRMAEDCVEQVSGVKDVQNQIRVASDKKGSGKETSSASNKETETSSSAQSADKRHRA